MHNQLIYRQERTELFDVGLPSGFRFILCNGVRDGLQLAPLLVKRMGVMGLMKDILKLATPGRAYACLLHSGAICSECYITLSQCRHYEVEEGAAVLGPVWTDGAFRGKGFASTLLQSIINALIPRGHTMFYIDTSDRNEAMQRVVAHCEFGDPMRRISKPAPIR